VSLGALSATPVSPDTSIQFSDSVVLTVTAQTTGDAQPVGLVTFSVNGKVLPAVATGASPSVSTRALLNQLLVPGSGAYTLGAVFTPGTGNFTPASASALLTVAPEPVTLTYGGGFLVNEGSALNLAVVADQRSPAGDVEFADYSQVPVWARFDVTGPGIANAQFALLADAADWSSTGLGQAQVSTGPLPAGAYTVAVHLVAGSGSPVASGSPFVTGDGARVGVAASPTTGSYASGAGFIDADSAANAGDPHGYFAFAVRSRSGQLDGSAMYSYRASLIEGGRLHDVDVLMSSTGLTGYGPAGKGAAYLSGTCTLQYLDSVTGLAYGNPVPCTFTTTAMPATSSVPAQLAVAISGADGSVLHTVSGSVTGGSVRVHL
jgi:hypothetical protein